MSLSFGPGVKHLFKASSADYSYFILQNNFPFSQLITIVTFSVIAVAVDYQNLVTGGKSKGMYPLRLCESEMCFDDYKKILVNEVSFSQLRGGL